MRKSSITYIVFASFLFLSLILFVQFRKGLDAFKQDLENYQSVQKTAYEEAKRDKLAELNGNILIYNNYQNQYNKAIPINQRDTAFILFPFRKTMEFTHYDIAYIQCLHDKILIDQGNQSMREEIKKRESNMKLRYGAEFDYWYEMLSADIFCDVLTDSDCNGFFPEIYTLRINENAWSEFQSFLSKYSGDIFKVEEYRENAYRRFNSERLSAQRQLLSETREFFHREMDSAKTNILKTESIEYTYSSASLGIIKYVIEETSYDDVLFQRVFDNVLREQWRNNRLPHGAMPYANCFGRANSCSGWGCSQIDVKSGGSDVVVLIKNAQGNTVRHGYIRAGRTLSFHVPNGRYQVYFNYGKGWNPDKAIEGAVCRNLRGGFVENVQYTKDSYESLYNQILTYTLISQAGGNFRERSSSESEFFK